MYAFFICKVFKKKNVLAYLQKIYYLKIKIKANSVLMKIPANIDFKELSGVEYFHDGSAEYKALKKINDDGVWKDYCNELLSNGISSRYDVSTDMFIIKPVAFETLKESLDIDDDLDIEADNDVLNSIENEPSLTPEETEMPDEINNTMKVVSLDDVMTLIKDILPNINNSEVGDPLANSNNVVLKSGEEDLKRTYFQSSGNETLDSEFDGIDSNIDNFKDKSSSESYITQLGSTTNKVDHEGITDPMEILNKISFDNEDDLDVEVDSFSGDVSAFDHMPYDYESEDISKPYMYDTCAPGYLDGTMDNGSIPSMETPGIFKSTLDNFYDNDHDQYDEGPESEELLLDDEFDGDSYMHPDIERINGDMDYSMEDEYEDPVEIIDEPVEDEIMPPALNVNKSINMGGQQVQIILTGVMITPAELQYIGESVKKSGSKLKAIMGVNNKLQIIVESNNKQYTINYEDTSNRIEPLPFSIKKLKFKSLDESLNRINYTVEERQKKVFKTIIKEDISNREINNFSETDIFNLPNNINYISNWNVMNIGTINLKNCLNENYSNITRLSKEPNTLVKNEENQYFLLKGNLRERSKVGIKKELIESSTKVRKNYGTCEVVGIFENTEEGLGEIMYITKKGSIPLLVWK